MQRWWEQEGSDQVPHPRAIQKIIKTEGLREKQFA
jgi:hypothetical protein